MPEPASRRLNTSLTRIGESLFERARQLEADQSSEAPADFKITTSENSYGTKTMTLQLLQDGLMTDMVWHHRGPEGDNALRRSVTDIATKESMDTDLEAGLSHLIDSCAFTEWEYDHAVPKGDGTVVTFDLDSINTATVDPITVGEPWDSPLGRTAPVSAIIMPWTRKVLSAEQRPGRSNTQQGAERIQAARANNHQ